MSARSPLVFILLLLFSTVLLGFFYSHLLTQDIFLDLGSLDDEGYVQGFYARENVSASPYRWSSGHSSLLFPSRGHLPFTISMAADAPRPEGQSQPEVSIVANGQTIGQFVAGTGVREYSFQYGPSSTWPADLLLEINTSTFAPPSDPRELGLLVNSVALRSDAALSPTSQLLLILLSVIPGVILAVVSYLVLRQAQVQWGIAVLLALFLLSLLARGVHQDMVTVRLIISLDVALVLVSGLMFLVRQLGWRPRLVSSVAGWCSNAGKSAGQFRSRVFTRDFVRSLGYRMAAWLKMHRWDLAIGAVLFVGALLVRLPYYLEMPHITEEFREVQIATEVTRGTHYPLFISVNDYMGIAHSYFLGFFLKVVGINIWAPRLYMVLVGALAVVLTYWLAREMATRSVAVVAAGLMLGSPMHILIGSHMAVANCTTPFFSTLMLITFYRGVSKDSGYLVVLSGFLAGIAFQTHPFVIFFFLPMFIWYGINQIKRGRSLRDTLGRPFLYVAVFAFLLAYGGLIFHNAVGYVWDGRVYMLSTAQKRDAMQRSSLDLWSYLQALRNLLQNLLSSISGSFDVQFSLESFLRPAMLFYGLWLLFSLVHTLSRRKVFFLLFFLSAALFLPFVNQNWSVLDKNRYLLPWLPICYIAMATFMVDILMWVREIEVPRYRTPAALLFPLALFISLIVVLYPVLSLWHFYQIHQGDAWNNRSILLTTETLRPYEEQSIPIYIDAELAQSDLPIEGSNLLKAVEYLLFLDGTESRVVCFEVEKKKLRTFDHDDTILYWSPEDVPVPSVWVMTPETNKWLMSESSLGLTDVSKFDDTETRFGVYAVSRSFDQP